MIELYHSCIDAILSLCLVLMPRLPSFLARKSLFVRLAVNSQNSEVVVRHDIIPVLDWELDMHVPINELLSSAARARSRRSERPPLLSSTNQRPDK